MQTRGDAQSDESKATTGSGVKEYMDEAGFVDEEDASVVTSSHLSSQPLLQRLSSEVEESWECVDDIFASDQTVCWLEQKLDEVESYLLSATSPLLEPLDTVTTLAFLEADAKPTEGLGVSPSVKDVQRGSPEEEAFLESAVVDAEEDLRNAAEVVEKGPATKGLSEGSDVKQSKAPEAKECVEETTLEATVLRELCDVVQKLGTETRLCIRSALFRLAESATLRQGLNEPPLSAEHSLTAASRLGQTGKQAMEACTNPFDRAIANLVFHTSRPTAQPSASVQSAATSAPQQRSVLSTATPLPAAHKHRCAASRETTSKRMPEAFTKKLPAVMTNKQLDYSSQPFYTKQPVETSKAPVLRLDHAMRASTTSRLPRRNISKNSNYNSTVDNVSSSSKRVKLQ